MATASHGVHLVGSIPSQSAAETFEMIAKHVAPYVKRIPDGEPGERKMWTMFQAKAFGSGTEFLEQSMSTYATPDSKVSVETAEEQVKSLKAAVTHYDTHAIQSFTVFDLARKAGLLPKHAKFQVSLPTPAAVLMICFKPMYRAILEPLYLEGLKNALKNIQNHIPHDSLSVQLDLAMEMAVIEQIFPPWWSSDLISGLVDRVIDLIDCVETDVDLGFHLCYGDFHHKHFKEPEDTKKLNDFAVALLRRTPRSIQFIHLPVPIGRNDVAYFTPLADLQKRRDGMEIYLGLVHPDGVEETRGRMSAAQQVVQPFGVSTECGMGRTPPNEIVTLLSIMATVSSQT